MSDRFECYVSMNEERGGDLYCQPNASKAGHLLRIMVFEIPFSSSNKSLITLLRKGMADVGF